MIVKNKSGRDTLNETERLIREGTERFSLAKARNLAALTGEDYRKCLAALDRVMDRRLVGAMEVGMVQRQQSRYYRAGPGPAAEHGGPQPKHPRLIAALLTRLALVESVFTVIEDALAAKPGRRVLGFHWRFDPAVDADVRFDDGWMAFKWSGIWQSRRLLIEYLEQLHDHLSTWNSRGRTPLPGTICFVASDAWQAELVRRSVRAGNWAGPHLIHTATTGETAGNYDLAPSVGKPPRPDIKRWLGKPDRLDRLVQRLMTHEAVTALMRAVTTIEQWPTVSKANLRKLSRLNGKLLNAALAELVECELVWLTSNGGYAADRDWLSIAARRDRVWSGRPSQLFHRKKIEEYYAGRILAHETGLAALAAKLSDAGCEVVPGWRWREDMGSLGQLAPDAMFHVPQGPFGAGWHYVEYELSQTSPQEARHKLRPYRSPSRSDDFPLLVATRRKAVKHYIKAGQGMRVLVAAVEDLRRGKAIGDAGTVWKATDGQPVQRFGA